MPLHQPFWCEENCWHLAADPLVGPGERLVLFVSGTGGNVACWGQHAAAPGEAVLWDYHVVVAVGGADGWQVWDLDTRLGCPLPAAAWIAGTFPRPTQVVPRFQPRFLVLAAEDYRRDLTSDRGHMRDARGGWQRPLPAWPLIAGGGVPLADYVARARYGLDLEALRLRLRS